MKKKGCIAAIILIVAVIVIVVVNKKSNDSSSSSYSSSDRKLDAWVCMQNIVSAKLKNPAGAKFPSYKSSYVTSLGSNDYKIEAYVDATNGFGATIRTYFTCTLTLTGSGYTNGRVTFYE